ncbi:hypothetical protein VNO78_35080 [Psophocarpus tetragonolobus]|uniref:CCHC-type domain-containing protein n=1 Tax=Psophocarpus tetragonolobus TaxID=3891 RepID=A0AAN9NMF2_PSOTE
MMEKKWKKEMNCKAAVLERNNNNDLQLQIAALSQHLERLMKQQQDEFHERSDPDAYLEWELKIEHVFSYNNYSEEQKVRLAAAEFSDYVLIWWNKLQRERIRYEEPRVDTWAEMKRIMRRRYIPSSFHRDIKLKLQKLSQGSKGVEEYYKEMEMLIIQAQIEEDPELTMARFLNGLNHDIRDVVELQEVKKEGAASSSNASLSNHGKAPQKQPEHPPKKTREVKCFKCLGMGHYAYECPTKKIVLLKDNGEYTSQSEASGGEEEESDGELKAIEGELYMIRRMLGSQVKAEDASQRENIFHTRCSVNGNVCLVIIDGGSCTNVVSSRLVSKMNMDTTPHPRPYKLQWLSEGEEVQVKQQAIVSFSIGKYQDKVICDVVPMEASHILLGRPWQYDTKAIHDGFTNKFSFMYQDKKLVLKPLSPKEVCEDQIKMREKLANEIKSETLERKSETLERKNREKKDIETLEEKHTCLAKKEEVKRLLCARQPLYLLYCTSQFLHANQFENFELPSCVKPLLQNFQNVFPESVPSGLPPLRGIEHHIDLIPGASLPNRPANRSNPQETKEIERQVAELMSKDEDAIDLGTNPLQEGGSDEDIKLEGLGGPMTRARTRRAKEAIQQVLAALLQKEPNNEEIKFKIVNCLRTEESNT